MKWLADWQVDMELLQTVFYTLVALGILVTFHEFGHFWVARKCGVKVIRFSVGFGTPLLKWRDRLGTEYVVAALPLGGYVKMADEREGEVAEEDLSSAFNRKTVWQRIAIVSAGPAANFLLAILIYWLVFLLGVTGVAPVIDGIAPGSVADRAGLKVGQEITAVDGVATPTTAELRQRLVRRVGETGPIHFEAKSSETGDDGVRYQLEGELDSWLAGVEELDPVAGLGITLYQPKLPPLIQDVMAGSAAEEAGLQGGDLLLSADGKSMTGWQQWVDYVRSRPGQTIELTYQRGGERWATAITPREIEAEDGQTIGQVGVSVVPPTWPEGLIRVREYGVIDALSQGVIQTWDTSLLILDSIKKMIAGLISAKHLSGPVTIAKVAGASAQYGLSAYLGFLALLSVSLGVLNLLPIPVLDGGHLAYYFIEVIKGRPVSEKVQMIGYRIGLYMVIALMVFALYNDLSRL